MGTWRWRRAPTLPWNLFLCLPSSWLRRQSWGTRPRPPFLSLPWFSCEKFSAGVNEKGAIN